MCKLEVRYKSYIFFSSQAIKSKAVVTCVKENNGKQGKYNQQN